MKNNNLLMKMTNPKNIENVILKTLKPVIEKWANEKLSSEIVIWGIRRYLHGSTLALHLDRLPTHILSAVLQVSFFIHNLKINSTKHWVKASLKYSSLKCHS